MVRGRFRHLVVVEGGELVGILSMRDIVRCWTGDGATCEVPRGRYRRGVSGTRPGARACARAVSLLDSPHANRCQPAGHCVG